MKNVENFDTLTGLVFADLYENFPIISEIKLGEYFPHLNDEGDFENWGEFKEFFDATLRWLN